MPGSSCHITFNDMPVFAIDSIITQGMVRTPPIAAMATIDHHGVWVGHAATATMDIAKPKAKMIEYCKQ